VKTIGAIALIDSGELDWKLIVVHSDSSMRNLDDMDSNELKRIVEWFRDYKMKSSGQRNRFLDDKPFRDFQEAQRALLETNAYWSKLFSEKTEF